MSVAIVVVSHSALIAEGAVELARQMAPAVRFAAAGGMDTGGIGTSFDRIAAALAAVTSPEGTVVLCDLGSAVLTAEMAVEASGDPRARIADAPLVEGTVAAAVASASGAALTDVIAAAEGRELAAAIVSTDSADVEFSNPIGLHARPAAAFVRLASTFDAVVTINAVDARSVLKVMGLGLVQGSRARIAASGPEATSAVAALVQFVERLED
jgi:PTS hybrid protein